MNANGPNCPYLYSAREHTTDDDHVFWRKQQLLKRLAFALAPKWLKQFCQAGEVLKHIAHGWWRNCTTGWEYRTP
jgi:hypothetical protein